MARNVVLRSIGRSLLMFRHLIFFSLIIGSDVNISGTPAYTKDLPELNMYVNRFYRLSKTYLPPKRYIAAKSSIRIEFGDLPGINVGLCRRMFFKSKFIRPIITIDRKAWVRMPKPMKEQLVFHELGHCALRRLHTETKIPIWAGQEIALSIMHPYLDAVPTDFYVMLRESYLEELFQN